PVMLQAAEIAARDNADDLAFIDDRDVTKAAVPHDPQSVDRGAAGRHGVRILRHRRTQRRGARILAGGDDAHQIASGENPGERALPDFPALHDQLQRHPYLTLQLAWEEYWQGNPEGYRYSRFCQLYQRWRGKQDGVLRREYKAGEKGFVDWAGATIPVHDPVTGVIGPASLFVMVLGASSYTYVEATRDQKLTAWISSHIHAFEYFGGVPRLRFPITCERE